MSNNKFCLIKYFKFELSNLLYLMFWSIKKRRERENPSIPAPKIAPTERSLNKYLVHIKLTVDKILGNSEVIKKLPVLTQKYLQSNPKIACSHAKIPPKWSKNCMFSRKNTSKVIQKLPVLTQKYLQSDPKIACFHAKIPPK